MSRGKYLEDSYEKRREAALKGLRKKSAEAKAKSISNLSREGKTHSKATKIKIGNATKAAYERALKDGSEYERRKKISETGKKIRKTKQAKIRLAEAGKKISETKLNWTAKKKAQVYNDAMRDKISKWSKTWWDNLSVKERDAKIKKFMEAPLHRALPNKVEQNVMALKIPKLMFTGDGNYFTTLGKRWRKNPDFIVKEYSSQKRVKAVVEIMDFEYWHTRSEAQYVRKLYERKGIKCLVINAAKCYKKLDLVKVKSKIESFIQSL